MGFSDGPVAGPSGRRRQWLQRQYRSIVQELARRHEPVTGTSSDGNNLVRPAEAPSIAVPGKLRLILYSTRDILLKNQTDGFLVCLSSLFLLSDESMTIIQGSLSR